MLYSLLNTVQYSTQYTTIPWAPVRAHGRGVFLLMATATSDLAVLSAYRLYIPIIFSLSARVTLTPGRAEQALSQLANLWYASPSGSWKPRYTSKISSLAAQG